jgi:glutathionylspermidine synthase
VRRHAVAPRDNWQTTVEAQGLTYHTPDGRPYWDESACYSFTAAEIDRIEEATDALHGMCLEAVEFVLANDLFDVFGVPPAHRDWVRRSWEADDPSLYGRFDLALPPGGPPKLLEYNADTPTSLVEAAVVQWYWLKDTRPDGDQFNGIHERLIEAWKRFPGPVHFAALRDNAEDAATVEYLRDTAVQAGLQTAPLAVEEIGWAPGPGEFVDARGRPVRTLFKLYPWEWLTREAFGPHLPVGTTRWVEPPWKMLLSNKAILPVLGTLFPDSPYLLRASYEPFGDTYVQKPTLGREGANVTLVRGGSAAAETAGPYGGPFVYQELCPLPVSDGNFAVVGSWVVDGKACGVGVREDAGPVTTNASRFVPHFME